MVRISSSLSIFCSSRSSAALIIVFICLRYFRYHTDVDSISDNSRSYPLQELRWRRWLQLMKSSRTSFSK